MDDTMIRKWNYCVKPGDTVYHLGDFALTSRRREQEIFDELNGHKIIILGNHDRGANAMASIGWEVYKEPLILYHDVGWYDDLIATYPSHVILSHYPSIGVIEEDIGVQRLNVAVNGWNYYPVPMPYMRGWLSIHGHSHNGRLHSPLYNRRAMR